MTFLEEVNHSQVFYCDATDSWGNLIPMEQAIMEEVKATWTR